MYLCCVREKKNEKTIYEVFCIYKIGIYVKYRKYILYIKYIGLLFVIKIINSNFAKNSMNKAIDKVNYTTKEYISEIYKIWQK